MKAVMFRSDARRLGFRPEEGMLVIVRCRATLYERDGAFQVYVNDMFPDGIGSAQLAFEQLKDKAGTRGPVCSRAQKAAARLPQNASGSLPAKRELRCRISATSSPAAGLRCGCCSARLDVQGFEAAKEYRSRHRTGWIEAGKWTPSLWPVAAAVGQTSGSSTRRSLPGQLTAAKRPSSAPSDAEIRFHDSGLCCRVSVRLYPLGSSRAGRTGQGRAGAKIMQPGTKYSQYNPKQAKNML